MRENIGDRVVDKLLERRRLFERRLREIYKTTKPFRMRPMTEREKEQIFGRNNYA